MISERKRYWADFKAKVALEAPRGKLMMAQLESEGHGGEVAREIGQLLAERDLFHESLRSMSVERRRQMIEPDHPRLSVARQYELVLISRSRFYHRPAAETPLN